MHESQSAPLDPAKIPNQDIEVSEDFLGQNGVFLAFVAVALLDAVEPIPDATDWDVRAALEALIQTLKTLQGGIYYEVTPDGPHAAAIAAHIRGRIEEIRKRETEATCGTTLHDRNVLGVLVFLQRLEYSRNNGRSRCRAFLDFLRGFYSPGSLKSENSLEPDAPRIIL